MKSREALEAENIQLEMEVKANCTVLENLKHDNNIMKRKIERIGLKLLLDEIEDFKEKNNKEGNIIKHLQNESNDMQNFEAFKLKGSDEVQKLIREIELIQKDKERKTLQEDFSKLSLTQHNLIQRYKAQPTKHT